MNLNEYQRLIKKVEQLKEEAARARGAKDRLLEELFNKFSIQDFEEAKAIAKQLRQRSRSAAKKFDRELAKVKEKWKDVLDEN